MENNQSPAAPQPEQKRHKGIKILCLVLALAAAFALGWQVMPKVWPDIKAAVFGQPKTETKTVQDLYTPASNAVFDDPIAATDSLIYYFYKDYCPWCRQLEPLTAGMPETITLPDGTKSTVKLVCLNKVEEGPLKIITDYYGDHAVPEERQYVPAIVIGDRYLFAGDEIIDQLLDALAAGEGLSTPLLNGAERIQ